MRQTGFSDGSDIPSDNPARSHPLVVFVLGGLAPSRDDRWLDILARSPALERLSLHYGPRLAATPWCLPDGPIPRPRDRKLADLDVSHSCTLHTFIAPTVRKLHLELGFVDSPQDYTPFVDMLVTTPDPAAVLDPTTLHEPLAAGAGDVGPGKAKAKEGSIFPQLEDLTVASLASWHALALRCGVMSTSSRVRRPRRSSPSPSITPGACTLQFDGPRVVAGRGGRPGKLRSGNGDGNGTGAGWWGRWTRSSCWR
ncbi:uncharacterized protein B0H18DRAFT_1124479 [Fomitopsis serialis]|uniref:uncharacterized protein n=1 Tax=Fomitopsis serialis TaxID=139415 RepID=UPI002007243E|nr:uncharacterized protein B0H18DRAFT_1124479 [Neoantrodia serialis]KAH9916079.1 hypothetical protein B0H18DRAFT_1124479 [Neoantrodia serialis]